MKRRQSVIFLTGFSDQRLLSSSADYSCFLWLPLDFWHFSRLLASWVATAADTIPPWPAVPTHTCTPLNDPWVPAVVPPKTDSTQRTFLIQSVCCVSWREQAGSTPCFSTFNLPAHSAFVKTSIQAWPHCPFLKPDLNLIIYWRFFLT